MKKKLLVVLGVLFVFGAINAIINPQPQPKKEEKPKEEKVVVMSTEEYKKFDEELNKVYQDIINYQNMVNEATKDPIENYNIIKNGFHFYDECARRAKVDKNDTEAKKLVEDVKEIAYSSGNACNAYLKYLDTKKPSDLSKANDFVDSADAWNKQYLLDRNKFLESHGLQ